MEPRKSNRESEIHPKRGFVLGTATAVALMALCAALAAPGNTAPARAQGSEATFTPPTPYQCMYIQYAYVTETAVIVGVNNNTGVTTRFQTATLNWPSGLGGSGGDYVDYFQWNGNQFYNGNDTAPPTSSSASNNATYQITAGQTLEFVAAFGSLPLYRPLYGSFSVTLLFRNNCSVSITIEREPEPSDCPTITNAYLSGTNNLYYVVYNNLGADTSFTGATLEWPDIPSPNRYVNYFRWGTDQFYGGNDNDPDTSANDPTPDFFADGETSFFRVNFGNPGTLIGAFTATLYFSYPCSSSYTLWLGTTPTPTMTATRTATATPTATHTEIPLAGAASVVYSALILHAPQFGLPAQTITGSVRGGGGPPYRAEIHVKAPDQNDEDAAVYTVNVQPDGTFRWTPADAGVVEFGCDQEGIWEAWFVVFDSLNASATSNRISWTVNFPRVHGIP
jgi:hypothetical protein